MFQLIYVKGRLYLLPVVLHTKSQIIHQVRCLLPGEWSGRWECRRMQLTFCVVADGFPFPSSCYNILLSASWNCIILLKIAGHISKRHAVVPNFWLPRFLNLICIFVTTNAHTNVKVEYSFGQPYIFLLKIRDSQTAQTIYNIGF
jgi:hypothetical protein